MEIYNGISDLILVFCCLYVFFKYLTNLTFQNTILWESFVLSVAASAFFGTFGFFGFEKAIPVSQFFEKLATITGGVGLTGAAYSLVSGNDLNKWTAYMLIAIGFLLFALYQIFDIYFIYFWVPTFALIMVLLLGTYALFKRKTRIGVWLILSVLFFALGNFRADIFGDINFNVTLLHLLASAGILSIGMASMEFTSKKST